MLIVLMPTRFAVKCGRNSAEHNVPNSSKYMNEIIMLPVLFPFKQQPNLEKMKERKKSIYIQPSADVLWQEFNTNDMAFILLFISKKFFFINFIKNIEVDERN